MGHFTSAYALRLNINQTWKCKAFLIKKETIPFFFIHGQVFNFIFSYFNSPKFHTRGIFLSHILTKFAATRFEINVFITDTYLEYMLPYFYEDLLNRRFKLKSKKKILRRFFDFQYYCAPGIFFRNSLKLFSFYRKPLYSNLSKYLTYKINRLVPNLPIDMLFCQFPIKLYGAETLARYIATKFLYKRNVIRIVNPISKTLKRKSFGHRIECAGRFNRRQRASFYKFKFGKLPLNTLSCPIDYYQINFPLRYGVCSIKVWLYGPRPFYTDRNSFSRPLYLNGYSASKTYAKQFYPTHNLHYEGLSDSMLLSTLAVPLEKYSSPFGKTLQDLDIPKLRFELSNYNDFIDFQNMRVSKFFYKILEKKFLHSDKKLFRFYSRKMLQYFFERTKTPSYVFAEIPDNLYRDPLEPSKITRSEHTLEIINKLNPVELQKLQNFLSDIEGSPNMHEIMSNSEPYEGYYRPTPYDISMMSKVERDRLQFKADGLLAQELDLSYGRFSFIDFWFDSIKNSFSNVFVINKLVSNWPTLKNFYQNDYSYFLKHVLEFYSLYKVSYFDNFSYFNSSFLNFNKLLKIDFLIDKQIEESLNAMNDLGDSKRIRFYNIINSKLGKRFLEKRKNI